MAVPKIKKSPFSALEQVNFTDLPLHSKTVQILSAPERLIKQIVGNKELLADFSKTVYGLLERKGIRFAGNEGCVFTPFVFETPVYAQKVAVVSDIKRVRGFGPQVLADSNPLPAINPYAYRLRIKPLPGIIEGPWGPTPGVILDRWWWIGIPAPEMLVALDKMRSMR